MRHLFQAFGSGAESTTGEARTPDSVRALYWLLLVNAAIWLGLGLLGLTSGREYYVYQVNLYQAMAVLMFGNAVVLFWVARKILERKKWSYYIGVAVTVINLVLTVTDDLGILDFLVLALNMVTLVLLIRLRAYFMRID